MKRSLVGGLTAVGLLVAGAAGALAAEGKALPEYDWSFDGIFGRFDRPAMQRGLQVYREVCSACHSLRQITFRNLSALGYSEDEIKALAAEYT
ncbi:MAG: cytochrome c1, partial [Alphaproteobacteria bacterium]